MINIPVLVGEYNPVNTFQSIPQHMAPVIPIIPPALLEYDVLRDYVSHEHVTDMGSDAAVLSDWLEEHGVLSEQLVAIDNVSARIDWSPQPQPMLVQLNRRAWQKYIGPSRPWTGRIHTLLFMVQQYLPSAPEQVTVQS